MWERDSERLKSSDTLKERNEGESKQMSELVNEGGKEGGKRAGNKLATE